MKPTSHTDRALPLALALLLLTFASQAHAGLNTRNSDPTLLFVGLISYAMGQDPASLKDRQLYVGGTAGAGRVHFSSTDAGMVTNENQFVYGLLMGEDYTQHFAVEMGLTQVGLFYTQAGGTRYATWTDALTFSALGKLPLGARFTLLGKLGAGIAASGFLSGSRDTPFAYRLMPVYGAGAEFQLSPGLALRLSWDHYALRAYVPQGTGVPGTSQTSPATVTGATLLYHF